MTTLTRPSHHESRQYWDEIARTWGETRPHALWRAHSDAVNSRLVARWLPVEVVDCLLKTDVFDEAVSAGLYPVLAERARQVVGIDIAIAAQRAALASHSGLVGVVADARQLPFAAGSFDAVVSPSTLDHFATVAEIAASLAEVRRVLRPGGRLVLTLDNPVNPLVGLRNALPFGLWRRLGIVPYQVGVTLGPGALRQALAAAGFEVVEETAVLHCPRVLSVALAGWLERRGSAAVCRAYLYGLLAWERLADWPTRFLTGHFVAMLAVRR
jgi:SAM-dependent methyltransferase